MRDPLFDAEDDVATPLTPDEQVQLIPTYITTRAQLNEAEQANIADADLWAFRRKRNVLDEAFLLNFHKRMLKGVWRWAGTLRRAERNRDSGVSHPSGAARASGYCVLLGRARDLLAR